MPEDAETGVSRLDRSRLQLRVLVILGVLSWVLAGVYVWVNEPYWRIENRVAALKTEADIRREFGDPARVVPPGETDYYVPDYTHKVRAVSARLLIYFPKRRDSGLPDTALYIYLDKRNRVEETYLGRR